MKDFLKAIGRGFAGVLRFGGRDGRAAFWPYAGFVFLLAQMGSMASMIPAMVRIQRYVLAQLEQARTATGPDQYSEFTGGPPDMGPIMAQIWGLSTLVTAATVVLLAAAVARRLHDRDRRGYWGLMPLPFLVAGLALMPRIFSGVVASPGAPDPSAFLALILNNLAYFGTLGLLIVLLAGPGTPGPNRFGPPPGLEKAPD